MLRQKNHISHVGLIHDQRPLLCPSVSDNTARNSELPSQVTLAKQEVLIAIIFSTFRYKNHPECQDNWLYTEASL